MRLTGVIGDRLVSGDGSLLAYEGPVAGERRGVDVAATGRAVRLVSDALTGLGRGTLRVGILSNHQVETYVSVLACVVSGHTFVPLNPKFPSGRLSQIVDLGQVDVIVCDSVTADIVHQVANELPVVNSSQVLVAALEATDDDVEWRRSLDAVTVEPSDVAYVMFTSGSTGTPKGVPVSYGNLAHYVAGVTDLLEIERGLRFTQFFDLSFDLSIHDIFVSSNLWGVLVAPNKVDLMMPSGFVTRERIDVWFSVPLLGAQLGRATKGANYPGLRHILFCGEALPMETVAACRSWLTDDGDLWNLYGPTEATIAFTAARVTESDRSSGNASIGHPFGRNQVALLVDGVVQRELTDGLEGEMLLGGPQVFSGYSTDSPSPFLDADGSRWYRSGDLVRIDHEGVYFRGRTDSQIKYRGYRIELGEIEAALRRVFGLSTVSVVLQGEASDARLVAFYITAEREGEIDPRALDDLLPNYMVPNAFIALDHMPTNQNGKIDRKVLAGWNG
jgi:D-alanine--poly(phosphoribitol) ligase subunit 1